jgi:CheY-like chemotaxis protein
VSPTAPEADDDASDLRDLDVLVVDDDGDMRDLLALLLGSHGATVRAVRSASAALDAIAQRRPDVMLADLLMPIEDGYSLIRTLRARESKQHVIPLPAIAVTAYATAADRERALTAGYGAHVAKPFDADVLIRTIAKLAKTQNV